MLELLGVLLVLLALAGGVGSLVLIARWILLPLDQAAKGRRAPAQFTLLDFLCLVFMAQLPTGLTGWMFHDTELDGAWLVYGFCWAACGALWWAAVRTLGRAGLRHAWHRAVLLAVVLPVTVFGMMVFYPLAWILVIAVFTSGRPFGLAAVGWGVLGEIGLLAVFYASGRYTRWLVASVASAETEPIGKVGQGNAPAR